MQAQRHRTGTTTAAPWSITEHPDRDVVYFKHRRIIRGRPTIELLVDRQPTYAGINPYLTLLI